MTHAARRHVLLLRCYCFFVVIVVIVVVVVVVLVVAVLPILRSLRETAVPNLICGVRWPALVLFCPEFLSV